MNRLPLSHRVSVLAALVEGNSIRGTSRMVGVAKGTVLRLLESVGDACEQYHDTSVRDLRCARIQCDEIWTYCHTKSRNLSIENRRAGVGDVWTWVAIDSDTKLIISWIMGGRTQRFAMRFASDLSKRITSRVQISTDGLRMYSEPLRRAFGSRLSYGQEVKTFGRPGLRSDTETRYRACIVFESKKRAIAGTPHPDFISTAHVERQNLTIRMSIRRFTRSTNAFSKNAANLQRALALHFMYYNFCRPHQTIKTTPAIRAGLTDRLWTLYDLANLAKPME